jgi:hypothetical protein
MFFLECILSGEMFEKTLHILIRKELHINLYALYDKLLLRKIMMDLWKIGCKYVKWMDLTHCHG